MIMMLVVVMMMMFISLMLVKVRGSYFVVISMDLVTNKIFIHIFSIDVKVKNIRATVSPVKQMPIEETSHNHHTPTNNSNNSNGHAGGMIGGSAGGGPSMQARLMSILSQVEIANESVQKAVSGGAMGHAMVMMQQAADDDVSRDGRHGGAEMKLMSKMSNDKSRIGKVMNDAMDSDGGGGAVRHSAMVANSQRKAYIATPQEDKYGRNGDDGNEDEVMDDESMVNRSNTVDDLEDTLSNWLIQQRRGVTTRNKGKHHIAKDVHSNIAAALTISSEDAEIVDDEDGLQGYETRSKYVMKPMGMRMLRDGDGSGSDDQIGGGSCEDTNSSKYLSNDEEVVDLQCMLAQALMGEDEED